jgi:D-alanyl-D-alanine carboxypeptidase/D-alanyl-D-alanine-endopeptidase (penicillin-binding protein 4)
LGAWVLINETWYKGRARVARRARPRRSLHLKEGSGISRGNRFIARGLAKVLDLFAPHADLLRGHDGSANKTGTLDGVRTLAGYASTSSHGQVRFVISLRSNDGALRFRMLRAIQSAL